MKSHTTNQTPVPIAERGFLSVQKHKKSAARNEFAFPAALFGSMRLFCGDVLFNYSLHAAVGDQLLQRGVDLFGQFAALGDRDGVIL